MCSEPRQRIQNQPLWNTSWPHAKDLLISSLFDAATMLWKDHMRVSVTAENVLQCLPVKESNFHHLPSL